MTFLDIDLQVSLLAKLALLLAASSNNSLLFLQEPMREKNPTHHHSVGDIGNGQGNLKKTKIREAYPFLPCLLCASSNSLKFLVSM